MKVCSLDFCRQPVERERTLCAGHRTQKKRGRQFTEIQERKATPASTRYRSYVQVQEGCWGWSGAIDSKGYASISESRGGRWVALKAHRVSYEIHHGQIPPGMHIDHMCHTLICTNPDHLRLATPKQNQENRLGANRNSKSGVRGVSWDSQRNKWTGLITHRGRLHHLGRFETIALAEQAVSTARHEIFTHSLMDNPGAHP